MKKPRIFTREEKRVFELAHIKHEILDYNYYLSKIEWLTNKIAQIDYRLSHGTVSAIPICREVKERPAGNWIVAAVSEQQDLMKEREEYCKRVRKVNEWLADLPREDAQLVRSYLIDGQNAQDIADNPKRVHRAVTRSLEQIAANF